MALNQLLLLPMQVRGWGYEGTAQWYQIIAFAGLMTVADLGLRSAGHAEMQRYLEGDTSAAQPYKTNWLWIRVLLFIACISTVLTASVTGLPSWAYLVIAASGIDAIILIRTTYLDSLRRYKEAETAYFITVAGRLLASATALLLLGAGPADVATINLLTATAGLLLQSRICGKLSVLRLFGDLPWGIPWRGLLTVRRTVAIPLATWCQIQLPVLVLAQIAAPAVVTMYVGLRAVFGLARATIQQISRVASVEYLATKRTSPPLAATLMSLFVSLGGLIALGVSAGVILDDHRLIRHWIRMPDSRMFAIISMTLGLALPFYGYQIAAAVAVRSGRIELISRNQFVFIFLTGVAALVALLTGLVRPYLYALAFAEIAAGVLFLRAMSQEGELLDPHVLRAWSRSSLLAAAGVIAAGLVARFGPAAAFEGETWAALFWTGCFGAAILFIPAVLGLLDGLRLAGAYASARNERREPART